MPQISLSRLSLLILIGISVFFTQLGSARLWDRDEPRNARASHEMLARGDWIVPTFNGKLRDHKPILLYWGQMISYLAIGESEFSARLPSALAALLTVAAAAVLASRLAGTTRGISREGFWAAGALATCLFFVMAGRAATPDACLIAFSTLGVTALVLSTLAPCPPYASGRVTAARWLPAIFGYTMLGLAALAKGPVGVVLPLTVVHVWWLWCRRLQSLDGIQSAKLPEARSLTARVGRALHELWSTFNPWQCWRAVWALRAIPGLLVVFLAAAPWYAAVGFETNGAFLRGFFLEHNVGRAMNSMEGHQGSLLFYPAAFLAGTFPWSLWLIPIILWARRAARANVLQRQMITLACVWIAVYVFAFSAAGTKLPSYITPCYVGAALVIGGCFKQFESDWALPSLGWRRAAYSCTIVTGIAIAGVLSWLSAHESMPLLGRAAMSGWIIAALGGCGFLFEHRGRTTWVPAAWLLAATAFQVILFGYGAKSVDAYRQDLNLLAAVKSNTEKSNAGMSNVGKSKPILFDTVQSDAVETNTAHTHWLSIGGMEPSWVHYLGDEIVEVTSSIDEPASWDEVEEFLRKHPDGNIIAVGDETARALDERTAGSQLELIASGPRFLRPGSLSVYRRTASAATHPSADEDPGTVRQAMLPPESPSIF